MSLRHDHDRLRPPATTAVGSGAWARHRISRRRFLRLGGGAIVGAAGAQLLGAVGGGLLQRLGAYPDVGVVNVHLAASDGWIGLPGAVPGIHPDPMAPDDLTTWVLGFRDVTGLTAEQIENQRMHVQNPAPLLYTDEFDDAVGNRMNITLTNLGLQIRPDLTDSHTVHFHGFRNAIPLFDGVPELSISVPTGRDFTYVYEPRHPGTYMYHCHFEDVEHVSMGMTGIVFVKARQNRFPLTSRPGYVPGERYAYNDGGTASPGMSSYDREFAVFLSEMWAQEHFDGAHIQEHDWSEYQPDFWLMNGRSYPDTLAPHGTQDADGNLVAPPGVGNEHLTYQPISSLITANVGERVLIRLVNLGFQQHAMTLDGIPMRVVGRDATLMAGRDGTDTSYVTNSVLIGPGESFDLMVTPQAVGTYLFYNRDVSRLHNPGLPGRGGQITEVRVSPAGTLPPQEVPSG
jgi:FtsP/CotA-like multicopper oxidase with cupredoxin domain